MSRMRSAVVAPMHEEMNDRAEEQQRVRHHAQNVRSVLLPEEERRDRQKQAEAQPCRDSHRCASSVRVSYGLHGSSLGGCAMRRTTRGALHLVRRIDGGQKECPASELELARAFATFPRVPEYVLRDLPLGDGRLSENGQYEFGRPENRYAARFGERRRSRSVRAAKTL